MDGSDGRMQVLWEWDRQAPLVLGPGWSAWSLFHFGSRMPSLLAMRRDGGEETAWFLDDASRVITHGFGELAPEARVSLREAAAQAAAPAVRLVFDGVPSILPLGDALLAPPLRRDDAVAEGPCLFVSGSGGTLPPQPDRSGVARPIGVGPLAALFGRSMLGLAPAALRDGALVLPSLWTVRRCVATSVCH